MTPLGQEHPSVVAVDLCCGAGGLTRGLLDAGLDVRAGYDIDSRFSDVFNQNAPARFFEGDLSKIKPGAIAEHFTDADFSCLAACTPCQPFSTLSRGTGSPSDSRWSLLSSFRRLVADLEPSYVTLENVPGLMKTRIFKSFLKTLEDLGYWVDYEVVNTADYGVPQSRRRLVLLGSLYGEIKLPPRESGARKTVRDAISHLPRIRHGQANAIDPLHVSPGLTPRNEKRIQRSRPGGTWRDWPVKLRAECHKSTVGSRYTSVYGRMEWDKPSPTITTNATNYGSGRFGHPEQDRAISAREAAILQTFPDEYSFGDDVSKSRSAIMMMIGNAVPPRLAFHLGTSILKHAGEAHD